MSEPSEILRPPTTGYEITWDSEIPGFGARVTAAGAIAFVLDYRIAGRKRRYTIGKFPELSATAARDLALDKCRDLLQGIDPLEQRQQDREAVTMAELASEYLEKHAAVHKRHGSVRNDKNMLSKIILPNLGRRTVKSITKRDCEQLHASLKARKYRANRVLSLLSKMFSLAREWGYCAENPVQGIQRFPEDRHERWLQPEDELPRFLAALAAYPDQDSADALRLLLVTGCREQEALSAGWAQFDLDGTPFWNKPSHATKERKMEHIPLNDAALELLLKMRAKRNGSPFLFPGRKAGKARVTVRHAFQQVCQAAGLGEETSQGFRPSLRIHDLRRTFGSNLANRGVSAQEIGRLMGHCQLPTTMRYMHLADKALRQASNVFAEIYKQSAGC